MLASAVCRLGRTSALRSPLKVAVVGAGPAGWYTAGRILSAIPASSPEGADVAVHLYERLPAPYGLVRYGVAPDHPDVRNCEHKFAQTAQDRRLTFLGNVRVGTGGTGDKYAAHAAHVSLAELRQHYTHIVYTYGASLPRSLHVPGALPGQLVHVHPALEFVNWYNGHPAAHDPSLGAPGEALRAGPPAGARHMAVIGAGNVALDVLRTVLRGTGGPLDPSAPAYKAREALAKSDVPEPVLAALAATRIEHVDLFARRGPAHVAFTNKELRELLHMPGTALRPIDSGLLDRADAIVAAAGKAKLLDKADLRGRTRTLALLRQGSKTPFPPPDGGRSWGIHFFHQPHSFTGSSGASGPTPVHEAVWELTHSVPGSSLEDEGHPRTKIVSKGKKTTTPADFVVASIGYQSESLVPAGQEARDAGTTVANQDEAFPFDDRRSLVPNAKGRMEGHTGEYVSGWLARGPTGVLGATMYHAYDTADLLLDDWRQGAGLNVDPPPGLPPSLQQPTRKIISAQDWTRIDQAELDRGAKLGKAREKFLTVKEMLDAVS